MKKWVLFLMMLMGAGRVDAMKLEDRYEFNALCPKETPFHSSFLIFTPELSSEYCFGCDTSKRLIIYEGHEDDFKICPNRKTIEGNMFKYSILENCPIESPMRDDNGSCIHCSVDYRVTTKDCNLCPNREYVDGKCVLKKE